MSLITPDFGLLFWMTLIFAIVFFILAKFGFPVITDMVEKRNAKISDSLRMADEAQQRLGELAAEHEALLEKARREQAAILKEASDTREAMIAQAREDARKEAAKVVSDARLQIEAERDEAMKDVRRQVALLSVEVAEKIVRQQLSDEDAQLGLIDRMVDEASRAKLN